MGPGAGHDSPGEPSPASPVALSPLLINTHTCTVLFSLPVALPLFLTSTLTLFDHPDLQGLPPHLLFLKTTFIILLFLLLNFFFFILDHGMQGKQ